MKKILKLFTVLLTSLLLLSNAKALETSFTNDFKGFAINFSNDLNKILIYSNELIPGAPDTSTFFKISSQLSTAEGNYAEGKILYCADGNKSSPSLENGAAPFSSKCYIRRGEGSNDKSIAYVYEHGYGTYKTNYSATEYLTGDLEKDYYITQAAMWYFTIPAKLMENFDFTSGTYNGQSNEITQKISKLILDAEGAKSGASLEIELSNTKMSLTNDGKYYITQPIKLTGKYINSQITTSINGVNSAFVTTNKDATSGNTSFNNNSTVYIKAPVESVTNDTNIILNVSATTSIEKSEAIECEHPQGDEYKFQPVIIFYPKNTTLNDSVSVNVKEKSYEVKISKRSITGDDELPGAKLKITDKNGNVVKDTLGNNLEWTSGEETRSFNLKAGDYILSETIAPKGYELSETTIEFKVNIEGKVIIDGKEIEDNLIIFKNTPEPKQVPTGNTLIYVAGIMCLVALGVSTYFIIKRKEL